jgi:glycosyltransferase involved in cell wall biosynthesis
MNHNRISGRPPLISVVIPAYNCGAYIAQAVASVLDQDLQDVEAIVVNDGSPDTPLLESELEPFREKIRYLKQASGGPSAARNAGIRHSEAKYIAFLDGDDFWRPGHLSNMMTLFQKEPDVQLGYCDCILLKGDAPIGRFFEFEPQAKTANFDSLVVARCNIATSTVVAAREAILKVGLFDDALRRCEDYDLWLRLAFHQVPMTYHTGIGVVRRVHRSGLSADDVAMKQGRIKVYEKVLASLQLSPEQAALIRSTITEVQGEVYLEEMKSALALGDYETARRLAQNTVETQNNWKVKLARIFMRTAPSLLRQIFLCRARLFGDSPYSTAALRTAAVLENGRRDNTRSAG